MKQPIRSVRQGQVNRTGQSKAFAKDKSIGRANQKRSPRTSQSDGPIKSVRQEQVNWTGQSKASPRTIQSNRPIRSVHNRTVNRTDQSSRVHQEEKARRSSNQIRLAGRQGGRLVIQTEASAQPIKRLRSILQTDHPSRRNRRLSQ